MSSSSLIQVDNFSSWKHVHNTVAFVLRYVSNLRKKAKQQQVNLGPLPMTELGEAETYLFRTAQREGFPDDIATLEQSRSTTSVKSLPKTSLLYKLDPWLDERGVTRMRSRIGACQFISDDTTHPIILPRKHPVTTLIIRYYHHKYHHCNHETVVNELRRRFHISRIRVELASVRRNCQKCKNETAVPRPPIMADLPAVRLGAFARPFTYIGVDYFGPMEVVVGRRTEKRWGMLITCLTVRAIHIELVCSLNTSSCIMGLRNFISRRGTPRKIYSDRGTNFIGASRELEEAMATVNQTTLMTPHMGGCWERLIRTVKTNLMAIRPASKLTDEVLRNTLIEVENVVNSRPLTHVPIDDDSAPALTPNHFLLGSSNGSKPLTTFDDSGSTMKQNYLTSQVLANQFWKRWLSNEEHGQRQSQINDDYNDDDGNGAQRRKRKEANKGQDQDEEGAG
ncbi:uncharacterized protein LOC134206524 [Armigeres subalbatus]|uniref:uncharacterized protein LOC134206524 n=1 Tax=Armigeres subalbatus TaxID=124917 RepID=UPI002ED2C14A